MQKLPTKRRCNKCGKLVRLNSWAAHSEAHIKQTSLLDADIIKKKQEGLYGRY